MVNQLHNDGRSIFQNGALHMPLRYTICFLMFLVPLSCLSAETREIVLKDGSVISGEVIKFDGTHYTIQNSSLGKLTINSAEIAVIRTPVSKATNTTNESVTTISPGDISGMQQQLMSNQEIMGLINSLQNDPQVQAILADPEIMQAISMGNIQALMSNPKFKALLDNPTIKSITEKNTR